MIPLLIELTSQDTVTYSIPNFNSVNSQIKYIWTMSDTCVWSISFQ